MLGIAGVSLLFCSAARLPPLGWQRQRTTHSNNAQAMTYTYIEVRKWDDTVVRRIDVTGRSERAIDRVENGMSINLNHDEYYVALAKYETEQPLNP